MNIDLEKLLELAGKATPGPWWIDSHGTAMVNRETLDLVFSVDCKRKAIRHVDTGNLSNWRNDNDATYIAAANPFVITKLVNMRVGEVTAQMRGELQQALQPVVQSQQMTAEQAHVSQRQISPCGLILTVTV